MPSSLRRALTAAIVAACLLGFSACSSPGEEAVPEPDRPDRLEIVEREGWQSFFEARGLTGTFALHQVGSDQVEVFDEARASQAMIPASTFKILNSMIILETMVVDDVDTVIPWDGVDRGLEGWNQDHTLRSAIEVSAVWVYQVLAREVGDDRMQEWVVAADYGNEDIGGSIDSFWLDGDLRISALQQIDFLTRFVEGELPFAPATLEAVGDILVRQSGPGWSWSHKTGLGTEADPNLGWLVGIVELESTSWVFAFNIDLEAGGEQADPAVRLELARELLEAEGVLPSSTRQG